MKNVFLSLLIFLSLAGLPTVAQDYSQLFNNLENELPKDPKVRTGKLKNGITYYIRQNSKPEDRLILRLVVNAGSLLETPDQDGLAHFAEHMCFNGTKNFEKNDIVKYLQSIGVKFGADLNAYTAFDETVYFLPIPTDNDTIINNGFQIIEDWAHNVTFDPEEIEKERGVILEELRLRNDANRRMANEYIPVLLNNPVFKDVLNSEKEIENIKGFSHESLIKYYRDWYRPDLMAVVAVGDLDPDLIEEKIKTYFGRIKPAKKPAPRPEFEIPDHQDTRVSIVTDKEATNTIVQVFYKDDVKDIKTLNDYKGLLLHSLYTGMLNLRLRELTQKPNPPFIFAGVNYGSTWSRNKNAFSVYAGVSETGIEEGLRAVLSENEKVRQHGFTEGELNRYKMELVKSYERAFNEREKTESNDYVDEYQRNYLEKEPMPGITFEYEFANHILEKITLEEVNALSTKYIKDHNQVIIVTAPKRDDLMLPEEKDLLAILDEVKNSEFIAYEDMAGDAQLLDDMPVAGSITSETKNEKTGVTYLELSNGIKVALKPTDFKNDEILFTAYSMGGISLYGDDAFRSAAFADAIVQGCGYGKYSPSDLQKLLAGKVAGVSPYINDIEEGMSGSCAPKDAETMFQLIHLAFKEPNANEDLYNAYLSRLRAYFKNVLENPMNYFYNERVKFLAQGHPRAIGYPTEEDFEKVSFDQVFKVYRERFADAGDFTFVFVGNFEVNDIKPLLAQYLASLPATQSNETFKDHGVRPPQGVVKKEVKRGNDPKSLVYMYFHDEYEFDRKTNYYLNSLAEALSIKLIEILREEQSGVYNVGAYAQPSMFPYENYRLTVSFPCGPENVESLIKTAHEEIKKIQNDGPSDEDMTKVKETQKREMEVSLKQNNFWRDVIKNSLMYEWSLEELLEYEERINKLSSKDIQETAKKYFNFENQATIVLYPEEQKD